MTTTGMTTPGEEHEHRFWEHAAAALDQPGVTRSTMMGLPCLRIHGAFFASFDRRTGDLLVKLPQARVDALIAAGDAHAFAPAGRRFREWAAIASSTETTWGRLIQDAAEYVAALPVAPPKRPRRP